MAAGSLHACIRNRGSISTSLNQVCPGPPQGAPQVVNGEGDAACIYLVCTSQSPRVVDLSHALAQHVTKYPALHEMLACMSRQFHVLAVMFRVGLGVLISLFFLPRCLARDLLSAMMPLATTSVLTTTLLLSTDILTLLVRNYEFWFLTVMNTINWIAVALVLDDLRALGCFAAWLGYQSVVMVDANHRTYATTLISIVASTPVLVVVAVVVVSQSIQHGNYFFIDIYDQRIADASDLVAFTSSTLVLFFVKLIIIKRRRPNQVCSCGFTAMPCAMLKARLRLVPFSDLVSTQPAGGPENAPNRAAHLQLLYSPTVPLGVVDARRTLFPYKWWRNCPTAITAHAHILRIGFYGIGVLAYGSITLATLLRLYALWVRSEAIERSHGNDVKTIELAQYLGPEYVVLLILSSASTVCFCGSFLLIYQRDLLRTVLQCFDFVFSISQPIIFLLCLCDANYWKPDIIVIAITWQIWFLWALTLDALTPFVKNCVLRFQKRFAAPVLASIIVATVITSIFLLFNPNLGFRDRVLFRYTFSNGAAFTVRTRAVFLGRGITVVMWCSRHAYLLFSRADDELTSIHGCLEYATPFPLISSSIRPSTRVIALPLQPPPASDNKHATEARPDVLDR